MPRRRTRVRVSEAGGLAGRGGGGARPRPRRRCRLAEEEVVPSGRPPIGCGRRRPDVSPKVEQTPPLGRHPDSCWHFRAYALRSDPEPAAGGQRAQVSPGRDEVRRGAAGGAERPGRSGALPPAPGAASPPTWRRAPRRACAEGGEARGLPLRAAQGGWRRSVLSE